MNETVVLGRCVRRTLSAPEAGVSAHQWLTTAPNPRAPATGFDAGQRGWRLHAVAAAPSEAFAALKGRRALCGVLPRHGWSLDLFVETRCARCAAKAGSG